MSDETLEQWVKDHQKQVEVSGRCAEALRLIGSDDRVWGQWPIKSETVLEDFAKTKGMLGEQLASGKHRAQLVILDQKGEQYAALPITIHGRNVAAATAAQETRTLQQATAIAISNFETTLVAQRSEITRLSERCDSLLEDVGQLVETVMGFRTQNVELDIMMQREEARSARLDKLAELCMPLVAQATQALGKAVVVKAMEAAQKKSGRKAASNGTGPTPEANGQSSNGAGHDGAVQSQAPPTNGQGSVPASGENGAAGPRPGDTDKSTKRRTRAPRAAKRAASKNIAKNVKGQSAPRTKSLTRKGKRKNERTTKEASLPK